MPANNNDIIVVVAVLHDSAIALDRHAMAGVLGTHAK